MKTYSYRYGKWTCKTYIKPVGSGFETGFYFDSKPVFVGNFIHSQEAQQWFRILNREVKQFCRKFSMSHSHFPVTWFRHFVSNHLYSVYYKFLDRIFARYNRDYYRACVKDIRKYRQYKKHYGDEQKAKFSKVA